MMANLLTAAILASSLSIAHGAGLCFMLYQMADNNLEYFIREDNHELIRSGIINNPNQNTWVYFDARNYGNGNEDILRPLTDVWNQDGSAKLTDLGDKYTGSRYLHWENGKMVAETTLPGEQNSDDIGVITDFLVHALTDCVSGQADQWFLAFSSHGGGFAGFGGDDYIARRKLLAANSGIVTAIQSALSQVSGAPSKLDVLGFDACLMQAFGSMDDFQVVTKYLLGSQAVEPGHGWAYDVLTSSSGQALDLAIEIVDQFVEQKQGYVNHQTPKVLAVASADGFGVFLEKFELFMGEMLDLVKADNDQDLYAIIGRSRGESLAFEGIVDEYGTKTPSALDIGSFLATFGAMCGPKGNLGVLWEETLAAYDDMFAARRYGEGTAAATGMQITWPFKSDYLAYQSLWDTVMFALPQYKTDRAPNYLDFLKAYLRSSSPSSTTSSSCTYSANQVTVDVTDGILVAPDAEILDDAIDLHTNLTVGCDYVSLEYGVDLTTPLGPFLEGLGFTPTEDDYLFLYGGDVVGEFTGSEYNATWDRLFYFITIEGGTSFEAMYVFDHGQGFKSAPVLYISEENSENIGKLLFLDFLFYTLEDWEINVGADYGFFTFSRNPTTGVIDQNLVLYAATSLDGTFAEVPRSQGGYIIPIVYVNAFIQGYAVGFLPGGFNQTILTWSEEINYELLARLDERVLEVTGADAVVADMAAYDFDWFFEVNGSDYASFDIVASVGRSGNIDLLGENTPPPTTGPGGGSTSGGFSFSQVRLSMIGVTMCLGLVTSLLLV